MPVTAPPIGSDDIQRELDELDKRVTELKILYDKYFLGLEKFEPQKNRLEAQRIINDLQGRYIRNTGAKFRRDQLKSKFLSYCRYWDRILKQIEEGTYRGHKVRAELHERERREREAKRAGAEGTATATVESGANGKPAANGNGARPPAAPGAKPDPVQRLLDQFVAAKKKAGERSEGLTRDKMAAVIQQQSAALKAKYNCKSVEFRVVVEGGKAKLKAIPK